MKGFGALELLSRREREVLAYVLDGQTSDQIASYAGISVKTVETHRAHINRKLGTTSPVGLILLAVGNGWISPHPEGGTCVTFAFERRMGATYEAVTPEVVS